MPHYIDLKEYRRRAEAGEGLPVTAESRPRILTVARIDEQKGLDIAIEAARLLKERGFRFAWYEVGGGGVMEPYQALVKEYGLEDEFVFVGARKNPFPCYRDCDIYVQPSRFEAYGLTIAEVRAFEKPIVTTDTVGGKEQIEDGKTGFVVPVGDAEALASAVGSLLANATLRRRFGETLALANANQIEETKKAWEALLSETKEGMRK